MKNILFITSLILFSPAMTFAQGGAPTIGDGTLSQQQDTSGQMRGGANKGEAIQKIGAGVNVAMGAWALSQCNASGGTGAMYCIMGAQAMLSAAEMFGAAGESGNVSGILGGGGIPNFPTMPGNDDPYDPCAYINCGGPGGPGGPGDPDDPGGGDGYAGGGGPGGVRGPGGGDPTGGRVQIDPTTGTATIDGEEYTADQLNSMIAGGGSGSAADLAAIAAGKRKAAEMTKKAMDKMNVVSMGVNGGGGGGSKGFAIKPYQPDNSLSDLLKQMHGKNNRNPASVAGLQKKIGGVPIGVSGDDIFKMIHRRYQRKRADKIFIER